MILNEDKNAKRNSVNVNNVKRADNTIVELPDNIVNSSKFETHYKSLLNIIKKFNKERPDTQNRYVVGSGGVNSLRNDPESYLLSQAHHIGSPSSPEAPAGHSFTSGAMSIALKAMVDGDTLLRNVRDPFYYSGNMKNSMKASKTNLFVGQLWIPREANP